VSALVRYAAAIYHLGPRQAARNLLHRSTQRARRFARYRRPTGALEWVGQPHTSFLPHAGGASFAGGRFTAIGRSVTVGDPPDWNGDSSLLWLFNLHYFGWLDVLDGGERRRLVLDWIEHHPPSRDNPGWLTYPLSLRLRHWVTLLFPARGWSEEERSRLLASIEAQAECLADTLEYHLRGNHLLESAITLKLLAACFSGPATGRWGRRADSLLDAELGAQFLLDGGHVEGAPR
jgi:uncharacterized heparinase superfamily protein